MNSVLRTLDLSTEVLAPVLVGTVMTFFGLTMGGVVIAVWNVASLIAEYSLLHKLYYGNAALQAEKTFDNEVTLLSIYSDLFLYKNKALVFNVGEENI